MTRNQMLQTTILIVSVTAGMVMPQTAAPQVVLIPGGSFVMGDHSGLGGGDANHPSDEVPLHTVAIDTFYIGKYHVTNDQYCAFLNDAFAKNVITVSAGIVFLAGGADTLFRTITATKYSRISFDGSAFSVQANRGNHPATDVRWIGAATYCNWLSKQKGFDTCYTLATGDCNFTKKGFRLPTEAEWEYAALGGRTDYPIFPWGSDTSNAVYGLYANWEQSGDPFAGTGPTNDTPFTTPAGFYDGTTHNKSAFNWPGTAASYQTRDGSNGYGLFDMSGNAWQWVNDWYLNPYYAQSPASNPTGPTKAAASPMPDGKPYHGMRGGNWFNGYGYPYFGHGRISNRNPSFFRGPGDPNGPWFHIGFRVALKTDAIFSSTLQESLIRNTGDAGLSISHHEANRITVHYSVESQSNFAMLRIIDMSGRALVTIRENNPMPGPHTFAWNGCDSKGNRVIAGCYLVTLSTTGRTLSNRIIIQ